jgi:hypothetical protein
MTPLADLNLIRLFDFYLALAFLLSTMLRIRQYRTVLGLVFAVPERWPRLFRLVKQHQNIFLTWANLVPTLVALVLCVINGVACRVIWPHAELTLGQLAGTWATLPFVAGLGLAMLGVDAYGIWNVGEVDRPELEKYFDQAEYWLRSWAAPVVRFVTLGYINPRQMVAAEVQSALLSASQMLNSTMWWVSVQTGLRIAYGLSIWLTFALRDG